jgi:hypothetical protein
MDWEIHAELLKLLRTAYKDINNQKDRSEISNVNFEISPSTMIGGK